MITELNIKNCTSLFVLACWNNKLLYVDISTCPKLPAVSVGYGNAKVIKVNIDEIADVEINTTNFPDGAFREYVGNKNIDINTDGVLSNVEIALTSSIDVKYMGISSLAGIEKFIALEYLDCSSNDLTALDVSKCTKLKGCGVQRIL